MRSQPAVRLNAICPYFTMFPLAFPLSVLRDDARRGEAAREGDIVLDPFCGRGTTNFAARVLGLGTLGIDTSPVATAITAAKLVDVRPDAVSEAAAELLRRPDPRHIPSGAFWDRAYHADVLSALCRLREGLLERCDTPERIALRGVVMGALHGPRNKGAPTYFSNQSPRTYAPKPAYAVRYWQRNDLEPEQVDVLDVIRRRALWYYEGPSGTDTQPLEPHEGACGVHSGDSAIPELRVHQGDSRDPGLFSEGWRSRVDQGARSTGFRWIITSPPYYGMRTYIPDQWLRNWFVGGPDTVEYTAREQLNHKGKEAFAADLRRVWTNAASVATDDATLVVRFGGITERKADPTDLLLASLDRSGWQLRRVTDAGTARSGKRQADTFLKTSNRTVGEVDAWATLAT